MVVLAFALGCADGASGSAHGVKRVTLTGNYVASLTGQGWNLENERIARDSADADFELTMTMVILLHPTQPQVGFCEQRPPDGGEAFKSVEDVPSDLSGCADWTPAHLGGNSPTIAQNIAGRGFVVRNRDAIPVAKLMTVSASIVEANVQVTFDLVKL